MRTIEEVDGVKNTSLDTYRKSKKPVSTPLEPTKSDQKNDRGDRINRPGRARSRQQLLRLVQLLILRM